MRKMNKLRLFVLVLVLLPLLDISGFAAHFNAHFTGTIAVITQQWHIVVLNVVVFLGLLIPLSFRRKANWKEYGLVGAFFVSLFVEMYGLPLTVGLASNYFFPGSQQAVQLQGTAFNFLGVGFLMTSAMAYGLLLMAAGAILIGLGWKQLYRSKSKGVVSTGLYSYSRHPQYLGFMMVVIGWLVGWPTILTILFAPVLVYKYVRVSRTEEKELQAELPGYRSYKEATAFIL